MVHESFGELIKEELLENLEHHVIQNTLVLENLEPYPGYHGAVPSDTDPESVFLIIKKFISPEEIFRISNNIRKYTNRDFDASPGTIKIFNDVYPIIRIRHFKDFESIEEIQMCYRDAGIEFQKKKKINATGLISLKKIFSIEVVDDNIFKDLDESSYYLKINHQLNWSHFKNVTRRVKQNLDFTNFDCAIGTIYMKNVFDVIRIFSEDMDMNELKKVHAKFTDILAKAD